MKPALFALLIFTVCLSTRAEEVAARDGWSDPVNGLRARVCFAEGTIQTRLNDAQIARGTVNRYKQEMLGWFARFMGMFEAYFGASDLAGARPLSPPLSSTTEDFVRPMLDVADLWLRINAMEGGGDEPPGLAFPVVLIGETATLTLTQAQWVGMIANLRLEADAEITAEGRAKRSRSRRRNFKQEEIYEAIKLNRLAMPGALPSGNDLQTTLPRLLPEDHGAAPEAVNASAVYVSGSTSKTTYAASDNPELKEYQLRGVIGDGWNDDDAVTIATNAPNVPREFTVDFGLTQPGTAIALKVYVITTGGRVARSPHPVSGQRGWPESREG